MIILMGSLAKHLEKTDKKVSQSFDYRIFLHLLQCKNVLDFSPALERMDSTIFHKIL